MSDDLDLDTRAKDIARRLMLPHGHADRLGLNQDIGAAMFVYGIDRVWRAVFTELGVDIREAGAA
jgi:hypothetical protein